MKILIWGLFFLLQVPIFAQEITLSDTLNEIPLNLNCWTFQDKNHLYSAKDILSQQFEKSFQKNDSFIPNFGYGTANIWLKIAVKNQSSKRWFLEIDNPRINHLSFFLIKNNHIIYHSKTGDYQPFNSYLIADRNIFFDLKNLEKSANYTIYLQANSSEDLKFPITFWEEHKLYQHLANRNLIWGIYFGFILLISLYNFFLWLTIRDKTYIFYVFYALIFGLLQADLYGYGFQYLWSNSFINDRGVIVFLFGSNLFMIYFLRNFWNLKKHLPYWHQLSTYVSWFIIFLISISTLFYRWYFNIVGIVIIVFLVLWFFYVNIKLAILRQKTAYFSLLAFSALMLASFCVILKNFGVLSAENQDYYLMIGSMIEMVLFSLALGDKFRQEQLEKERQQYLRDEIAANLHDDLAASLSSLTMFSESNRRKAQKELSPNELIFKKISEKSRDILNLVRENVWEMNPRNDESDEWLDRIIKFTTETLESKQITVNLKIDEHLRNFILPIDYRRDFYLFIKEAVNNMAKHSEADLVNIDMQLHHQSIHLTIKDNGKGFDTSILSNGNGLLNFQNRANRLKAKFDINSEIGQGTTLNLTFKV
jgi:signal transduction histidine kinase